MSALQLTQSAAVRQPTWFDRVFTLYIYAWLWMGLLVYLVIFGPFLLLAGFTFDRRRNFARRIVRRIFPPLVRHFCRLRRDPWTIDAAALPKNLGPCIVVANHGSMMDSVLLMGLPPGLGDGRIWSKGWPFRIPLLGWLMRLSGHLFVEDFNILPDAQSCLGDGTSLIVFPESSRSRTGKLGRFRDGAFLLAVRTNRPIVAVAIHGAHHCFPPGQPWIFGPPLKVQVVAVLWPTNTPRAHIQLKRQAHHLISQVLTQSALPLAADAAA